MFPTPAPPTRPARGDRWSILLWLGVAAALLVAVVLVLDDGDVETTAGPTETSDPVAPDPTTTTEPTTTTQPPVTSTTTRTTPASTTTVPVTTTAPVTTTTAPAVAGLQRGGEGDDVLALQQRLTELGYWLGAPDGVFGDATFHAVVALQKVAGISRDGIVGPVTEAALAEGTRPDARSSSGRVVEIDLDTQVLLAVEGGAVVHVFDTSTGRVAGTTPIGQWTVTREIDGLRESELGLLYRPKYFYGGVAVHGYTSVPPYPASHGCVRVTYPAMDAIWADGLMPIGTPVWVY